jgi:hypothetical protein
MSIYTIDSEAEIAAVAAGTEWDVYDATSSARVKKTNSQDFWSGSVAVNAAALQAATLTAAKMVGAGLVIVLNTGTTPGTIPVDTAANLIAALPAASQKVGTQWLLLLRNNSGSANTATLATDASSTVTMVGTMTVAQNASRLFLVAITAVGASPTATITSLGLMTGA